MKGVIRAIHETVSEFVPENSKRSGRDENDI